MASGLVSVPCPACRQVHALPLQLAGAAFTCPNCRAAFIVPRAAPPAALAAPASPPMAIPVGPRPPHLAAVPPVAPPAFPLAKPAQELPIVVAPARSKKAGRIFGQVLAGSLLAVLAMSIVGGVALSVRFLRDKNAAFPLLGAADDEGAENENPILAEDGGSDAADSGTSQQTALDGPPRGVPWTSAAHEPGVSRGGVRVRVQRVEFGAVLARDDRNNPITAGPGDFLKIYLEVENRTDGGVKYVSWFGNEFAAEGKQVHARLWDDAGKSYPQQRFDQHRGIQGHTPQSTLSKGERVRDVVIFAVPASAVNDSQRTFRLQLPGGAVGGRSFYRFEIPRSMLAGD